MRYLIHVVAVLMFSFSVSVAKAQNKVVVIPLNTCPPGFTKCDSKCVDTVNNSLYCGNCATVCPADSFCHEGLCVNRCEDNNICTDDIYDPSSGCSYTGIPGPDCPQDCNGDWGGTAYTNTCGCVGGNTGVSTDVSCVTSTSQVWMDRNLGASRVATSSTDTEAYGDLYQWGRLTDGHEKRSSTTTTTMSTTDVPGHGSFILWTSPPYDWRTPQNDNLWQGESGTNNPCPAGFRLPTRTELETEKESWSTYDSAGAFASPLKLVVAGYRPGDDGLLYDVGTDGHYASSTVDGTQALHLKFLSDEAYVQSNVRAYGFSVRCIRD